MTTAVGPPPPPTASRVFGAALPAAEAYAALLVGVGAARGVIGPREADRIWDRHLLNSATLAPLLPADATVVDVGSGGGLPGLVVALLRPDLRITLVDSMARRAVFLQLAVAELGLADRVDVVRARAEELHRNADAVIARAVAAPMVLAGWCRPLLRQGGSLRALIGDSALAESDRICASLPRTGWGAVRIRRHELEGVSPTVVLEATRS